MKTLADTPLLGPDEPPAAELSNPQGRSDFVLLCDHAANRIPRQLTQLGLSDALLHSHIAWDAGALAVASGLSERLDATLVQANYSRLVIDCNRAPGSAQSILAISDGVLVEGNQHLDEFERHRRVQQIFLPYHNAIDELLDKRSDRSSIVLSIHSFNPQIQGTHKPWHIGVCYAQDRRLADRFLAGLPEVTDALVGDNQPFDIDPDIDYTLPRHAASRGLRHVMLELRRDCIATPDQIRYWADSIAQVCDAAR